MATATGQSAQLDEGVAVRALAWGRETLKPEFRGDEDSGKVFGPEVAVPPDSPSYTRLAAFFGRDAVAV